MRIGALLRLAAFGVTVAAAAWLMLLAPAHKTPAALATANPLPPLIGCPNLDASTDNKVAVADILSVVLHYGKSYGESGYEYIWDPVMPYNDTNPVATGEITIADVLFVVTKYGDTCSLLDTQIATATRAIGDPAFASKYCDPAYSAAVNCGGDPQFLTEDVAFLASKGYRHSSTDVPGQGIHYVNFALWDPVFNPARPEGLVYQDGVLAAQLYYVFGGDVGAGIAGVGWGPDRAHNVRAADIDSLPCAVAAGGPPNTGCSWSGSLDGWHWHANLCTGGIGLPNAFAFPGVTSQEQCASFAASQGITCTFPDTSPPWPSVDFNCAWGSAVGWMGHLWNWLPNANYTNALDPGPGGLNVCQAAYCGEAEANGRFADCAPDGGTWNAYNCPQ